jgi:hypothetical protein
MGFVTCSGAQIRARSLVHVHFTGLWNGHLPQRYAQVLGTLAVLQVQRIPRPPHVISSTAATGSENATFVQAQIRTCLTYDRHVAARFFGIGQPVGLVDI